MLFLTSISLQRERRISHIFMKCMICVSYFCNKYICFCSVCVLLYVKCLRFRRAIRCCFWPDLYKVSALPVLLWQVTDFVKRYIGFQKDAVKSCNVILYDTLFSAQFVNLSALKRIWLWCSQKSACIKLPLMLIVFRCQCTMDPASIERCVKPWI